MKIAISVDSAGDIRGALQEKYNIFTIPFPVTLGEEVLFDDGKSVTPSKIVEFVNETGKLPRTSAINIVEFEEYFKNILKKGYDAIIHITISGEVSGTLSIAKIAAEKFENVKVIDSRGLAIAEGLIAIKAAEAVNEGKDFGGVMATVTEAIEKVKISFVVKDVLYLHKGGRCSGLAMMVSNMLKLKPRIVLSDGKMCSGKKYRGNYEEVLKVFTQDFLKENNPDKTRVAVEYTTCEQKIVKAIKTQLKEYGFKEIIEVTAGATITCHCGPDTFGFAFFNQD